MKKNLLYIIFILFLVVPFLTRPNLYSVGGDDMKLYYIFPLEYLSNFAFNIVSDNTLAGAITGYSSVAYFAPLYILIYILKLIPLNTQLLMYGINYAFAFYFFYKLTGLLFEKKDTNNYFWARLVSGIFYVTSPFLINTLYQHQLLHIYLVSVIPAVMYFYIKSIYMQKSYFAVLSVLVFSIFTTTYGSLPNIAAFFLGSFPLILYLFFIETKTFLKYTILSAIVFLLLNFYWIFHFLYSNISTTGLGGDLAVFTSEQIIADNRRIIMGVSRLFNPLNIVLNQMKSGQIEITLISQIFNAIFLYVIVFAGTFINKVKKGQKEIYLVILVSFLFSWYLFSPGFGDWGPRLFLAVHDRFSFFGMFRNMFDKFSLVLAFYFSFALFVSLSIIKKYSKQITNIIVYFIIFAALLFNLDNFLYPDYTERRSYYNISGELEYDFLNIVSYFENLEDPSRVLWLPLNFPTYTVIPDANNNGQFYFGLSPMRVLAGRADLAGKFSFLTQQDVFLGDKVFELLENESYKEFGNLLQKYNVGYIVVKNNDDPEVISEFLYGGVDKPILSWHKQGLYDELLGEKINDFGDSYTLYKITDRYANNKIFLTNNINRINNFTEIDFEKINSNQYLIKIRGVVEPTKLVFLEPYDQKWNLYVTNSREKQLDAIMNNNIAYDYANYWTIDPETIISNYDNRYYHLNEDGLDIDLVLFFEPSKYNSIIYLISITAIVSSSIFVGYSLYSSKNK